MSKNLWDEIIGTTNLRLAWDKVRSNKGSAGGDNVSIHAYNRHLEANLNTLTTKLSSGDYLFKPYRLVEIAKRKGGFRRLMIPSVEDRLIQTSITRILTEIIDPQLEESSFAYRPGRSVKQAIYAIERWRDEGYWHVIEADIISYFDHVKHSPLLTKLEVALEGHAGVADVINFISDDLEHQAESLGTKEKGLVQGSPLSPLLANLYLDVLDEEIVGRGIRIVRFADDFVILCKRRKFAEDALEETRAILAEHGLELHNEGTRILDFDRGFEFLGQLFVRSIVLQVKRGKNNTDKPVVDRKRIEQPAKDLNPINSIYKEAPASINPATHSFTHRDHGPRILYVNEWGSTLSLQNESFAIQTKDGTLCAAIAHHRVDRIEVGPHSKTSKSVMEHCLATETEFAFVDSYGSTQGLLVNKNNQNGALHLAQARCCIDPELRNQLARNLVEARIRNCRTQLFRLNRRANNNDVVHALNAMHRHLRKLQPSLNVAQLRGIEGASAAEYWPALGLLCEGASAPFRRQRPAKTPLNATLNYLAAMLERDIRSAILASGLHTGFGTLHAANNYSDAAVYDIMEAFRAPLSEGLAAYLFNAKRLRIEMFTSADHDTIRISGTARQAIIKGYEAAISKRINITGKKGKLAWRAMMRRQALDLAKAVRSADLSLFQPYLMEA